MPDEIQPHVLAAVRLGQSRGCLASAERELSANLSDSFKTAANRSYYCIYHAMRAVLALENFDSKKHSGVISKFNRDYVKTGIFPQKLKDIVKYSFEIRNDSDYDDFYCVSKAAIVEQVENAKTFLAAVEEYLSRAAPEVLTTNVDFDDGESC